VVPFPQILSSRPPLLRRHTLRASLYRRQRSNQKTEPSRFASVALGEAHLMAACYVSLNPVRARVVPRAEGSAVATMD
jgi:hypothetical protein